LLSLNRFASLRRFFLLRMFGCQSGPSSALPVITIFTTHALLRSASLSSSFALAQRASGLWKNG